MKSIFKLFVLSIFVGAACYLVGKAVSDSFFCGWMFALLAITVITVIRFFED